LGYSRIYFYKKILETFKIKDFEDFAKFPSEIGFMQRCHENSRKID